LPCAVNSDNIHTYTHTYIALFVNAGCLRRRIPRSHLPSFSKQKSRRKGTKTASEYEMEEGGEGEAHKHVATFAVPERTNWKDKKLRCKKHI